MTCRVKILCAKTGLCLSPFEKPLQVVIQQSLSSLPPLFLLLVLPLMSVNHRTQIASGSFESSCRNGASIGKKLLKLHLTLLSDLQSAAKSIFLPVRPLGKQGSFPTAHFTPRTNRGGMLPLAHQSSISCGLQHACRSLPADKLCVTWGSDNSSARHGKS